LLSSFSVMIVTDSGGRAIFEELRVSQS
jgi:hypothetical protein